MKNWDRDFIIEELQGKKKEIQASIREEQERVAKIESAIKDLDKEQLAIHCNVSLKKIPSYPVLALRKIIPDYFAEGALWEQLGEKLEQSNIRLPQNTLNFAIYHDSEYKEADVDVEVCAVLPEPAMYRNSELFRETEEVETMACFMVYGPFENIGPAFLSFARWLSENGRYKMAGQNRQIVHRGPWNEQDPEKYLTEIQIPVEIREKGIPVSIGDLHKIAPFFSGWEETLIWSCLQGHMGCAITDNNLNPSAAQIVIGDLCFFAGKPNDDLASQAAAPIIIPRTEEWSRSIEAAWGDRVEKALRYAIKKEPCVFDLEKLKLYAGSLDDSYSVRLFDKGIYESVIREEWSKDFCSQFADYEDYSKRGIGVAVIHRGEVVAGASSYTVYNDGIEIEVDTKQEYRRKGLATACCARLILECLNRGLYPSWDAHDLRSVALAEKLGYHMDHPYTVYIKKDFIFGD
jgi:effector-binding domain-containing protein/GNAT superfamily N-acetyltransferase